MKADHLISSNFDCLRFSNKFINSVTPPLLHGAISSRSLKNTMHAAGVILMATMSFPSYSQLTSGTTIAAPASVLQTGTYNSTPQGFNEKSKVTLAQSLTVDGGSIPAGTVVDSHMIFLNPSPGNAINYSGAIFSFDGDIIGVMSDTNGNYEINSSSLLGVSGTSYPTSSYSGRGMEAGTTMFPSGTESYSISGKTITFNLSGSDFIRVITRSGTVSPPVVQSAHCIVAKTGGDFTSIGAAVKDAKCANGLIKVWPGTYVENVLLSAGQHLQGSGRGHTIIQASSASAPVVTAAGNTTIDGFSLVGGTSGVYATCSGCSGATVRIADNEIYKGSANGIAMTQYVNGVVEENNIHDTATGVSITQYATLNMRDTTIASVNTGAYFYYGTGVLNNNKIATKGLAGYYALDVRYSSANIFYNIVDSIYNNYSTITGRYNVTATGSPVGP